MDETRKLHINGESKFCSNCGVENNMTAKFCASCGESFVRTAQGNNVKDVIFEPRQENEPNSTPKPIQEESVQNFKTDRHSNSNRRYDESPSNRLGAGAVIAIILTGVVAAALLIFIVFQVVEKNKSSNNSSTNLEAKVEQAKKDNELQQMKNDKEVERRLKEEEQKRELSSKEKEIQDLRNRLENKTTSVTNSVPVPSSSSSSGSDPSYVMNSSNSAYITYSQLDHMSKSEIELVRNEIYARRGYIFKEKRFRDYFGKKSWYYPNSGFHDGMFNPIEKANIDTIVAYEKDKGWR